MGWYLFCVFFTILVQTSFCLGPPHCSNNTEQRARGCTTQLLNDKNAVLHTEACQIEYIPPNSQECKAMSFKPIESNTHIGGVTLRPYIQPASEIDDNYTVLNISFSNIKWKTMKFRFQVAKQKPYENHCRNIVLAHNVSVNDQSVLYYDCYWYITDGNYSGQSHILDFEARYDHVVNTGQYRFNVPTPQMLSPTVTVEQWRPFIYLEILSGTMRLHIMPPSARLNVTAYQIKVMKDTDKGPELQRMTKIKLKNHTEEVTYDYSLLNNGSHYFVVTPLHGNCSGGTGDGCNSVESPKIDIKTEVKSMEICIVSVMALVVATLFGYYIALRVMKKYWCRPPSENYTTIPSRVLVVYTPVNSLHAECVDSFVNLLRHDYGLRIMYDADISNTSHKDPYIWATEAFEIATHIVYIVSPAESNFYDIYDSPKVNPHQKIDTLLLARLQNNAVSKNRKLVSNVFFEHSDRVVPIETKLEKSFYLLNDWNKLVAHLSENRSPKQHIGRTEVGQMFLDDLSRARKLLNAAADIC